MNDSIYREFAAMQFYRMDCANKNVTPVRWGTMRADLKVAYLAKADAAVMAWAKDEAEARVLREQP